MPPLHRLPTERELAEQFGVSRSAVREAIRALERTGLVTVRKEPRGGIFVAHDCDRPINGSIANLLAGGGASLDTFSRCALMSPTRRRALPNLPARRSWTSWLRWLASPKWTGARGEYQLPAASSADGQEPGAERNGRGGAPRLFRSHHGHGEPGHFGPGFEHT